MAGVVGSNPTPSISFVDLKFGPTQYTLSKRCEKPNLSVGKWQLGLGLRLK